MENRSEIIRRTVKVLLNMGLVIALMLVTFLAGGQPKATQAAERQATSTPEKTVRWRFAMYNPSMDSVPGRAYTSMFKRVYERTNGRLQVDIYPGGSLGYTGFDHPRVIGEGLVEAGDSISAAVMKYPAFAVFSQVMLFKNADDALKGWDAAKVDLDSAAAAFNSKITLAYSFPMDHIASTKRPFATVKSLKGAKVRSWNVFISNWLKEIGSVPQVIPAPEIYTSLATGVVEANFASAPYHIQLKTYEICPYYNLWRTSAPVYTMFVNRTKFQALPSEIQAVLMEESAKAEQEMRKNLLPAEPDALKQLGKLGVKLVNIPEEEIAKAQQAGIRVSKEWLKGSGPAARAVMEKVVKALGYASDIVR